MRKQFFLLILILSFFAATAQSKCEKAVANKVEQLRKAMIDADAAALDGLVKAQLSYGHSGGNIDDKKQFIEKIASGKSDFITMDLTEQTIQVIGKTAIIRHVLNAKTNDDGKPGQVHLKVMLVWQKQKGKWKLLARQAVKVS